MTAGDNAAECDAIKRAPPNGMHPTHLQRRRRQRDERAREGPADPRESAGFLLGINWDFDFLGGNAGRATTFTSSKVEAVFGSRPTCRGGLTAGAHRRRCGPPQPSRSCEKQKHCTRGNFLQLMADYDKVVLVFGSWAVLLQLHEAMPRQALATFASRHHP
jgi:hypothetical protein